MSSETVADVVTEVWENKSDVTDVEVVGGAVILAHPDSCDPMGYGIPEKEKERARIRARIAACAPEALLLLDHIAHSFEADTEITVTGPESGELYDRIDALLKKAGLR